jgi:hypothetical protein
MGTPQAAGTGVCRSTLAAGNESHTASNAVDAIGLNFTSMTRRPSLDAPLTSCSSARNDAKTRVSPKATVTELSSGAMSTVTGRPSNKSRPSVRCLLVVSRSCRSRRGWGVPVAMVFGVAEAPDRPTGTWVTTHIHTRCLFWVGVLGVAFVWWVLIQACHGLMCAERKHVGLQ